MTKIKIYQNSLQKQYYVGNIQLAVRFRKNKKVLVRKRKKHTARRLASTYCAVLVGGTPISWPST